MSQATLAPTDVPLPHDDEILYEVVDGQRVEMPPMAAFETVFATKLTGFLAVFLNAHRLGQLAVETLFLIDSIRETQRRPDVAYISFERWSRERRIPRTNAWAVIPDLAIEVISPSNMASDVLIKIREYFRAGVRLVWVMYPVEGQCYVYDSPRSVRILERGDTLDGGTVLPGFQVPLSELFEEDSDEADVVAQPPAASPE